LAQFSNPLPSSELPRLPYYGIDLDGAANDDQVALDAYNICYTGLWTTEVAGAEVIYGFYDSNYSTLKVRPIFYRLRPVKFNNIKANLDKMRILGAGIKMWSEEAPINTGGYSVGGWMTVTDIHTALQWTQNTNSPSTYPGPLTPGALAAVQPRIRFPCRTPGVKGSTVRYSCLQTADQTEMEYAEVPSRLWMQSTEYSNWEDLQEQPTTEVGADIAIHDLITPGSFVPCIFWNFNNEPVGGGNGVYTIKLMATIHVEGLPTGDCPFGSLKSQVDLATQHVKVLLENLDEFPPAVSGHSFKSFMTKANHVIAKVSRGASHVARIMQVMEQFGQMLASQ
jgi:hypothetical protein